MPIQRTALTGLVKNSNTVSGLASICTSRSTMSSWLIPASTLLPFLGLGLTLELLQAEAPETLYEFLELFQPLGTSSVEPPRPFAPLGHETGLLEYAQVLRNRRPGHVKAGSDLTGRELTFTHEFEDLP